VILVTRTGRLIVNETKRIGRDNLMLILSVYPILLGVVGKFLVPFLRSSLLDRFDLLPHYPGIFTFFILANPFIYGAVAAFSLLDEREENILNAIRITPVKLSTYLLSKIVFIMLVSIVSGMLITAYMGLVEISILESFVINSLMAFLAPFNMMLINSFSKNRVEGFALVKGTGFMILLPVVAFYVPSPLNLFFGVIPGYWPAMAIYKLTNPGFSGMPYWGYILLGLVYILIVTRLLYNKFSKKLH